MNEPTKEPIKEAMDLRNKFADDRGCLFLPALAKLIAHVRTEAHNAALEQQLEAARKDAVRLDVLLRALTPTGQLVCGCYDPDDGDCDWSFIDWHGNPLTSSYDTPREVIDALAAIEASKAGVA